MIEAKIVVVDDEKMVTSAFKTLFKVEGIEGGVFFNSPIEALEYIKTNAPDLIISDYLMPEMKGLEFLQEAKKLYPETSMILLTGYADKENAIKAINEVGLYKYIEKPWDNDDLMMNIKNGVERSHLLERLREKIKELEDAKKQLELYSNNLEKLVEERTHDLSEANQKLSGIIAHCADGIVILDEDGKIEQINPACENLIGVDVNAIIGRTFTQVIKGCKAEMYTDKGGLFGLDEDTSDILLKDCYIANSISGARTPVEINLSAILDETNSRPQKYIGVIRDITSQKETERLRDDFIATLTHDLRTPLLAAIQTLKFFLDGSLGELEDKQKVLLSTMLQSNEDLLGLVNALLEVYRFDSGKLELCKTVFAPKSLVDQCIEELLPLANNKNIKIEFDTNIDDKLEIYADKAELKRVITNLCGNAVNYTDKEGNIKIILKAQSGDLIFSVEDNGNGIPQADIPNLFKRFSQGTSRKRSTGTGLGLYLSRQIIEAHGGKIWVESKLNKGSEFTFILTDVVVTKEERQVSNG